MQPQAQTSSVVRHGQARAGCLAVLSWLIYLRWRTPNVVSHSDCGVIRQQLLCVDAGRKVRGGGTIGVTVSARGEGEQHGGLGPAHGMDVLEPMHLLSSLNSVPVRWPATLHLERGVFNVSAMAKRVL